ncbi:MAG: glpK1 [Rhizobium sp.]|nr:glpK1 [Rhizobium sp.]
MKVVAIDQGTTSTKALLVTPDGEATSLGAIRHEQHYPRNGWLEHSAKELLDNIRGLLDAGAAAGATVMALANQGETVVAWNRCTGEPLAPAIVWQDQRTEPAITALRDAGREADVQSLSGLPLDSYFSGTKLKWLLDHVEGARELARQGHLGLGTSDSYFIERLTGRYATDVTTASRTSLMNLDTCQWDSRLCDIFGVPEEILPEIALDAEPFGTVATPHGPVTLIASVVDQIAALYGHGCRAPGEGKITVGTGAFALVLTGNERPAGLRGGSVPTAAWQAGRARAYAADGAVYTAAAAVDWLVRIGLLGDISELADLSGPSAASRGVYFVPALSGLACPHWDRSAAGLFIGMDSATDRQDLVKAVLEGIAFRIAEVVDTIGFSTSAQSAISLDGGLTRSNYFLQFLSDICRRTLSSCGEAEVTALGVGWLALANANGRDAAAYLPPTKIERADTFPSASAGDVEEIRARFSDALRRSTGWRKTEER